MVRHSSCPGAGAEEEAGAAGRVLISANMCSVLSGEKEVSLNTHGMENISWGRGTPKPICFSKLRDE